jgi:hypothetical protein
MNKIDRIDWRAKFSLKSYGVRIGIRSNQPNGWELVRPHLPRQHELVDLPVVDRLYSIVVAGNGARANTRRLNLLYADEEKIARSRKLDDVLERLESDLRLFVAEVARHRVFVHAGVVGWKGQAIVIPGRSYSGKSTLVSELVRAGATYYSDEYAVFDTRGRVYPFPKPLEMRSEGEFKQTKIEVTGLGGRTGAKPLPVGLVVVTQYKAGARWRQREISSGQAVLALLANTVSARRSPDKALGALKKGVATARSLKGVRGDAGVIAHQLLATLEKNR